MSAYKIETWVKKGYTEEEALYQIKIRRPTNKEYFMHKFGMSDEEAQQAVIDRQTELSKRSASRSKEHIRKASVRCKEYWMSRGMNEAEALDAVRDIQATFSLKKCIAKYGVVEGTRLWKERQERWQNTINSKSDEEKHTINSKKNVYKLENFTNKYGLELGRKKFKDHIIASNGWVFDSYDDLKKLILEAIQPLDIYLPVNKFIKKYIRNYFWELIPRPKSVSKWLSSFIDFETDYNIIIKPHGYFNLHLGDSILRSGKEIVFYKLLTRHGLIYNIDYYVDRRYNDDTLLRYDFYFPVNNIYVEICGFSTDEKYNANMEYKKQTFGSFLLWNESEYENFIVEYLKNAERNSNSR